MKTLYSLAVGLQPAFSILARRITFPLLLLIAGLLLVQPCAGQSGTWEETGSLNTARYIHTATLLPNGKVLVAGGIAGFGPTASAELYDPATGTWTATGNLNTARDSHTATLLPNGKVLVVGGLTNSTPDSASAELYDPASGTWIATGSLIIGRYWHAATLLSNGKVLVAAGENFQSGRLASTELYDPASGTWSATGSLATARYSHTVTLLPNGKVLAAGGYLGDDLASTELYDPASGTWTATGSLVNGRFGHTATLLSNGKVLAAGGFFYCCGDLASAELYVSDGDGGLALVSAASVKGPFAIDLPLTGPSGVEDRSGGPNKKYTVVMTFDQNITSVGSAISTCGGVQSIVIDSSDAHKVNINLVNVAHGCNESTITITANSISDDQGNVLDSASVGLGLLLGDVNGDRVVNRLDTNEAQMHKGQRAVQQNFRSDVNADGHITQADIELIRQQQGTSLP
jgi:hypothetical protein